MENKGQIYKITCIINNKSYVGQTTTLNLNGKPKGYIRRWKEHIRESRSKEQSHCIALANAIKKYGDSSFKIELITECEINMLDELETKYIKEFNTLCPNGYNIQTGGKTNKKHCDESRKRMSLAKMGNKNHNFGKQRSQETKQKISLANSGVNHPMYGKKYDKEYREKLSSIRKNDDLPMYLIYQKERPKYYCSEGYAIVNHPNGKNKYFTSKKMSLQEKYNLALKYLNELDSKDSSTTIC